MDGLVTGLRWLQLAGSLVLVGGLGLLLLARDTGGSLRRWREGLLSLAPGLAALVLSVNLGLLACQVVSVTGRGEAVLQWGEWQRLLRSTRYGAVWQWRQAALLVLLGLLVWQRWQPWQRLRRSRAFAVATGPSQRHAPSLAPGAPTRPMLASMFALALVVSVAGVFSGHAAATEPAWLALGAQCLHAVAAGLWAGAMPALAYGLWLAARGAAATEADAPGELACQRSTISCGGTGAAAASPPVPSSDDRRGVGPSMPPGLRTEGLVLLRRFSVLATASVLLLGSTGGVMAYLQLGAPLSWPGRSDELLSGLSTILERTVAPLLGSAYGLHVMAKILLMLPVLLIAARIRWVWMPQLAADPARPAEAPRAWGRVAAWASAEAVLALLVLLPAARLSVTLPAAHDQLVWPLPFRWSLSATWEQAGVASACALAAGLALLGLAGLVGAVLPGDRPHRRRMALGAVLSLLAGAAVAATALGVEAYPDTYRRSESGYTAVSVTQGAALFQQHCTGCHGRAGRGDGPQASGLPRPAANLTEPHTALHTAGDIFWWLSHGRPSGGMPGFAELLSVEQRWDLVNFLRAFSAGHQARILGPAVAPGQPWLGPPDFDAEAADGTSFSLKDQRGRSSVLLVFFSPGPSDARMAQLAGARARLQALHTEVLAVPLSAATPEPVAQRDSGSAAALPVVIDGGREIVQAFLLFRRTLSDPGKTVLGESPPHMEFLVDRHGYLRARWLPVAAGEGSPEAAWRAGWGDIEELARQARLLDGEPRIRPPPDDHVH